jgi:hypothetical protein
MISVSEQTDLFRSGDANITLCQVFRETEDDNVHTRTRMNERKMH